MTYHSIQTILTSIIIFATGMFVFLKDPRSKLHIIFGLFCFSVFLWLFGFSLMYLTPDPIAALNWARFGDIGVVWLPILAFYFTIIFLDIDRSPYSTILYLFSLLAIPVLLLLPTKYMLAGIETFFWGYYPIAGSLYWMPIAFFVLFFACIPMLYAAFKKAQNSENAAKARQIQYVLLAYIGAMTGFVDYLPKYHIVVYPWGHISTLIFIVIISYAIMKHHLMDIDVAIQRGLLYSIIVGSLAAVYFVLLRFSTILVVNGMVQPPLKAVYVAAALTALVLHLVLGIVVLLNSPKKVLNRVFFLLSSFIFVWIVGCFIESTTKDAGIALLTERIVSKFYVFTPALFLHTNYEILKIKDKRIIISSYLFSGLMCLLSFTPLFLIGVSYNFGARYLPIPGLLFSLFPMSIAFNSYFALTKLFTARKQAAGYYRIQLDYLLLAGSLIVTAVFFSLLLIYNVVFTPFDEMLNIAYGVVIGYAILRHRLLDITIVIRKGLIYSILIGFLTGLYILGLFLISNFLGSLGTGRSTVFSVVAIILFAMFFQPLRDRIQDLIDKVFFRGKYDYQKTLKELSRTVRGIAGLDEMLDKILSTIVGVINVKNASAYVFSRKSGQFIARKSINSVIPAISMDDPLAKYLEFKKEAVIHEEVGGKFSVIKELGAVVTFPMILKGELVGFLNLGEKLSGEVYSNEDIDLISTLCNQMGISIENATLYEDAMDAQNRLYQADKLATVGALAAGLAHEIKNPITAIKGFSQVIDRAITEHDTDAIKDFRDVVPRQLDRINEIVEKLLTLSKPSKLEKTSVDVNVLLKDIIKLVEKQAMNSRVELLGNFSDLPLTNADPGQLTQAFLNLILNAIQSMPSGGQVEIDTRMMGPDKLIIEIIDHEVGIPKDQIARIFDPFYTTKTTGSGLGLAVTKKIIEDHHGKIEVESEPSRGTKFTVILLVSHT